MNSCLRATLRSFSDPGLVAPLGGLPPLLATLLGQLQSLALLVARLYLARVFWLSGLSKLNDWSSTLALFQEVYQVPLLPPVPAAYLGTAGELALPVLLAAGLGGRFAAAGLFVVNLMAVLSLSADDRSPAALAQHSLWGVLGLMIALWGAGRWSLDAWQAARRRARV